MARGCLKALLGPWRSSLMIVSEGFEGRDDTITGVFRAAFAASEGAEEGDAIAGLVRRILATTPTDDLRIFTAEDSGEVIGAVAFTCLRFPEDAQRVMLLSPMAVSPARWKTGVGQALIAKALVSLAGEGVEVALTYGDPAYYGQVGFLPITEGDVSPPLPLSMPQGWLGRRLNGDEAPGLSGPSHCVEAFQDAGLW